MSDGALKNIRKRRARQAEALAAAKSARPVNPSPSIKAKTRINGMDKIRAANPPTPSQTVIPRFNKTGGLRRVVPPTHNLGRVQRDIELLESQMRKNKKKKKDTFAEARARRAPALAGN